MGNRIDTVVHILPQLLPVIVDSICRIVELFQNRPQEHCPIDPNVIIQLEHHYQTQKEELERRQAQLEAQTKAIAGQISELNEKMKGISVFDQEMKFERERRDTQLEDRYKLRDKVKLEWLRQEALKEIKLDYVSQYNIGITGPCGSGKSTMINGFCGLRSSDPGAAPVNINECTLSITKYPHPAFMNLVLWDCPGAGTLTNPLETYFYDKFLFAFDYLIFVFSEGVREIEIDLMKQAIAHQVPFCFVRNKANDNLRNKCYNNPHFQNLPKDEAIKHVIDENKRIMREELERSGIAASSMPPMFVINSWALIDKNQVCFQEADLITHVLGMIYNRRNPQVVAEASGD